uniref:Nucleotidyltransferase domain-containing protein n=1 Tax=Caldimicrobium thiodismutans TaxID=1653476 RepID=A0A832GPA4_9BACT
MGSRAKGRAKSYSDFDVVVIPGEEIRRSTWLRIKEHLEESLFPYSVDLLLWNNLDPQFQKIVLETGRCLYEKE